MKSIFLFLDWRLGFRETHKLFPQEIYYSVTHEQAKAYKKRWAGGEGGDEDVLGNQGAQTVLSPVEAGMGISAMKFPMPRPVTPSSEATKSPNPVSSVTSTVGDAGTSTATSSDVAHIAVEGLELALKEQGDSLQSQFVKLEKRMQQQQATFEGQIKVMGTQFQQQQALFQQLQESSNEHMRLLVEQFARLNPTTDAQP